MRELYEIVVADIAAGENKGQFIAYLKDDNTTFAVGSTWGEAMRRLIAKMEAEIHHSSGGSLP